MNSIVPDIAYSNQIKGATFITNFRNNVTIPHMIEWDSIDLAGRWHLENAQPERPQENEEIETIIKNDDGSIDINFARKHNRAPTIHHPFSIRSRRSASSIPSVVGSSNTELPRQSTPIRPSGLVFPIYQKPESS